MVPDLRPSLGHTQMAVTGSIRQADSEEPNTISCVHLTGGILKQASDLILSR